MSGNRDVVTDLLVRTKTKPQRPVSYDEWPEFAVSARLNHPLLGMGICILGVMVFAVQDVVIKLMSSQYSLWQLAFVRAIVVLGFMCPILLLTRGVSGFRTHRLGRHLVRGCLAVASYTCYYIAISRMPLVEAGALYASAPLFATLLSATFLGEAVGIRRWSALVAGFVGVLFMLQPGIGVFQPVALFSIASAAIYAYSTTVTRALGATDSALAITIYSNIVYLVVSGTILSVLSVLPIPAALLEEQSFLLSPWQAPGLKGFALMVLCGVLAGTGFFCLAQAYRVAPVSTVAPVELSYLLWATIFGFFFFGNLPGLVTCAGAAVVIGAGVYIIRREAALHAK